MSRSGKTERDAAFTVFMVAAEPSLMRTAWLLTGSTDAARELVQASLVKTYASWSKVRPETALAFTRRVLVNHKVDVRRARSREVLGDAVDRPAAGSPGGSGVSDDRDQVVRLLARLPEQQRKVVVLRYYADLSEAATAEALGGLGRDGEVHRQPRPGHPARARRGLPHGSVSTPRSHE